MDYPLKNVEPPAPHQAERTHLLLPEQLDHQLISIPE